MKNRQAIAKTRATVIRKPEGVYEISEEFVTFTPEPDFVGYSELKLNEVTSEAAYGTVALLFPNDPKADTELCDISDLVVTSENLSKVPSSEQAEQGEDCYFLENGLVTLCYYPANAELSPADYLAEFVAMVTA